MINLSYIFQYAWILLEKKKKKLERKFIQKNMNLNLKLFFKLLLLEPCKNNYRNSLRMLKNNSFQTLKFIKNYQIF